MGEGHWVSHNNLFSVPRDYESEKAGSNFTMCARQSAGATDLKGFKFWGYRRAEGRPGIRNHVLILPTCACGSESSRIVASQVRGAVNIVFNTGCSDVAANTAMSQKVLTGFACNPNVYGVVIIGLGCETVPHLKLKEKIQSMTSKPVVSFGIQDEGGTLKTIEKAVRAARDMAAEAAMQQKELFDVSEFFLGIECGGSDAYPVSYNETVDQAKQEQSVDFRPMLKDDEKTVEDYDNIYLVFPNWWGDLPMPLYSFLDAHDLAGKTVNVFVTHEGSRFSNTVGTIQGLEPDAVVQEGLAVQGGSVSDEEQNIRQWVKDHQN